MNADIFAEWLSRRGHVVKRTSSSYWYNASSRIYQAFPYHKLISPDAEEFHSLLWRDTSIALRYSTLRSAPKGIESYHVVYEGKSFELEQLHKKVRYDVRMGLNHARIESISLSDLANKSWQLREDTLKRQGREGAETERWWHKLCTSASQLSGFEAWAAVHDGQLVASMLTFVCEGCCSILYQQSATEHLKYGVNNALAYHVSQDMLQRLDINMIFYGLHSLDAPSSVDEFKFRMGYSAKPVRQRVVFHPLISPAINPMTYTLVKMARKWQPGQSSLAKLEGMMRFYLQGK